MAAVAPFTRAVAVEAPALATHLPTHAPQELVRGSSCSLPHELVRALSAACPLSAPQELVRGSSCSLTHESTCQHTLGLARETA